MTNVYVGHRYVPLIEGQWDNTRSYEGLTVVQYEGASYTSKKAVPIGVSITNEEYWVVTGNYNAQVETYRQEFVQHKAETVSQIAAIETAFNDKLSGTIYSTDYLLGDGSDETVAFQQMLQDGVGKHIHVSRPPVNYKLGKIDIPSNTNLFIQSGTLFEITLGALPLAYDSWINLIEKDNIFISAYGVKFNMIKSDYPVGGQWNHAFYILGCKNVYIEGASANNSGGDGFYVGKRFVDGSRENENVTLHEVQADNNARQGISLCSGRNMALIRPRCTNSVGSSPQAGIDLEVEGPNAICENWSVVSPYTAGNKGAGIAFNPSKMVNTDRYVDIVITDHRDNGSTYGFHAFGGVNGKVGGIVTIKKPFYQNNVASGILANDYGVDMPLLDIENPTVLNANTANTSNNLFDSGIGIVRDVSAVSTNAYIGNVRIQKPIVIDTRTPKQTSSGIFSSDLKGSGVKNCFLIDPIQLDSKTVMLNTRGEWQIRDSNKLLTFKDIGSTSVGFYNRQLVRHNQDAVSQIVLTLASSIAVGTVITFEVLAAQNYRIVPQATATIRPLSPVAGKYIQSNVIGSRITLELVSTDLWVIKDMVGTWTVEA